MILALVALGCGRAQRHADRHAGTTPPTSKASSLAPATIVCGQTYGPAAGTVEQVLVRPGVSNTLFDLQYAKDAVYYEARLTFTDSCSEGAHLTISPPGALQVVTQVKAHDGGVVQAAFAPAELVPSASITARYDSGQASVLTIPISATRPTFFP